LDFNSVLMKNSIACFFLFACLHSFAQTNIISTNPIAEQVLLGNYNPLSYQASVVKNRPDTIAKGLQARISADSLKATIVKLGTFYNRNTASDTASSTKGIGAARRWVYSVFQQIGTQNENRLIPSYLQFDQDICGMMQHRNIFAVLPGTDTSDKSVVILEGHMDSRCAGLCDTSCRAEGMEDNATGTALVMELARVMSRYSYKNTIVFMVTIGEEQSLAGAEAFASYVQQKGIKVKAVMNNDVIGGIICGQTSSPPGCPGLNAIDSTQVRLFSFGGYNSAHKNLARFVKLQYKEELRPYVKVPMTLSIMSAEDRTGRGGDHIPFRQKSYTAMRFTSANEHGDASNSTGYTDRQHTSDDILGKDINSDMVIDSYYVDFNYLARNAAINGVAAGMAAIGPQTPDFTLGYVSGNKMGIAITQATQYAKYRVAVRTTTNDWDSVYTINRLTDTIEAPGTIRFVSIASVDANGTESLFSREYFINATGNPDVNASSKGIELLQNRPNPSDESTIISILVNERPSGTLQLRISDMSGKEIRSIPVELHQGMNEVLYEHGYNVSGTYIYSLLLDGKLLQSKRMVFAN
jgi:hypothetical protein